jgi:hypothetical protein
MKKNARSKMSAEISGNPPPISANRKKKERWLQQCIHVHCQQKLAMS